MTAKMNSEFPVRCVLVTFKLLSFDFLPKIEMYSIDDEARKFTENTSFNLQGSF